LLYTTLSIRLDSTMDFITSRYIYIRKATIRLKSSSYYRALSSNYSMVLLLVYGNSLVIRGNILLGSKIMLGTSYLDIFGPLLIMD